MYVLFYFCYRCPFYCLNLFGYHLIFMNRIWDKIIGISMECMPHIAFAILQALRRRILRKTDAPSIVNMLVYVRTFLFFRFPKFLTDQFPHNVLAFLIHFRFLMKILYFSRTLQSSHLFTKPLICILPPQPRVTNMYYYNIYFYILLSHYATKS